MSNDEYTPFEAEKSKENIPYDFQILMPQIKEILMRFKSQDFGIETHNAIELLFYSLPRFVQEDIHSDIKDFKKGIFENPEDLSGFNRRKKMCMGHFQIIKQGLEDHGFLRESTSLRKESL